MDINYVKIVSSTYIGISFLLLQKWWTAIQMSPLPLSSFQSFIARKLSNCIFFLFAISVHRLLMESCHKLATSWHLILATNVSVRSRATLCLVLLTWRKFWSIDVIISIFIRFCRFEKLEGSSFSISDADYFVFHSPYNKVVQLSWIWSYDSAALSRIWKLLLVNPISWTGIAACAEKFC